MAAIGQWKPMIISHFLTLAPSHESARNAGFLPKASKKH
jgi:hypothetical protein